MDIPVHQVDFCQKGSIRAAKLGADYEKKGRFGL